MQNKIGLVWMVYVEDFNAGRIVKHNIFDHYYLFKDIQKEIKKLPQSMQNEDPVEFRKAISEILRHNLMYYYWSKCEWEIILSSWPPAHRNFKDEKVDVFDQVEMNWEPFLDYVIANIADIHKAKLQ